MRHCTAPTAGGLPGPAGAARQAAGAVGAAQRLVAALATRGVGVLRAGLLLRLALNLLSKVLSLSFSTVTLKRLFLGWWEIWFVFYRSNPCEKMNYGESDR